MLYSVLKKKIELDSKLLTYIFLDYYSQPIPSINLL